MQFFCTLWMSVFQMIYVRKIKHIFSSDKTSTKPILLLVHKCSVQISVYFTNLPLKFHHLRLTSMSSGDMGNCPNNKQKYEVFVKHFVNFLIIDWGKQNQPWPVNLTCTLCCLAIIKLVLMILLHPKLVAKSCTIST